MAIKDEGKRLRVIVVDEYPQRAFMVERSLRAGGHRSVDRVAVRARKKIEIDPRH